MIGTLLAPPERRATSIENPSVPLSAIDADSELYETLTGGTMGDAGVRVSVNSGLQYSPLWRGVHLIATTVAKTPLVVYREGETGGRERDKSHPSHFLVHRKPNRFLNAYQWLIVSLGHMLWSGRGNGYTYIVRRGDGSAMELIPLNPNRTFPVRYDGAVWYVTELLDDRGQATGQVRKLPYDDVIHFRGMGFDGLVGYDPVKFWRATLGEGMAIGAHQRMFYKQGATPGVILERPRESPRLSASAEAELIRRFNTMHQGIDRAYRTALLQEGTAAKTLTLDARKSQTSDMRQFNIREVSNLFGIPAHLLGDTTRTSFASLEQENQTFLDSAIDPHMCMIEHELDDKLLTERQQREESHAVRFVRESLRRVDFRTMIDGIVAEVNNGLMQRNEAREIRNRPRYGDTFGDAVATPLNMALYDPQTGELIGTPDPPPPEPDPDPADVPDEPDDDDADARAAEQVDRLDASARLARHAIARLTRRICDGARRAAKRPDGFVGWVESIADRNRDAFMTDWEQLCRIVDADPDPAWLFDAVTEQLLTAAECRPAELEQRVDACCQHMLADPDWYAAGVPEPFAHGKVT